MKNHYYTDPLAAAWMAKYHNMRFELIIYDADTKENISFGCDDVLRWSRLNLDTERFGLRYYIHPDSLHLLELQDGDLVQQEQWAWYVVNGCPCGGDIHISKAKEYGYPIIQRNGIAFMMPESE